MENLTTVNPENNNPHFQSLLQEAQVQLLLQDKPEGQGIRAQYWNYLIDSDIHTPPDSTNRRKMLQLSQYLESTSSLIAVTTQSLYDHAVRDEASPDSPDRWYADGVEDAHQALIGINTFFQKLADKNPSPELSNFLLSWQAQIKLSLAEALSLYGGLAIHLKNSPCAVLFASIPVPFPKDRPTSQVFEELLPLWNESPANVLEIYQSHLRQLIEWQKKNKKPIPINMPAIANVFDFREYFKTLQHFWNSAGSADLATAQIHQDHNTAMLSLSRETHIFIRHTPDRDGQARVNIAGKGDRLKGISYRVDQERSGKLGMDFCRVGYDELLKIAQVLSKLDPAFVDQYTHALNAQGRMKKDASPFYTPAAQRGIKGLQTGHVIGMLAALGMQEGKQLGINRGTAFNYHLTDVMNEFETNFEQISRELAGLFI